VSLEVAPTLALYVPRGHLVHALVVASVPYVPLGQRVHSRSDVALPEPLYVPAGQLTHDVAPLSELYVPLGQLVHVPGAGASAAVAFWYVPAGH
jgi:hypothetical protein